MIIPGRVLGRVLLSCALMVLLLAGAWYTWTAWTTREDASSVSVSTDRQDYSVDDTVRITIRNTGNRPVDIFCPSWCALGNFPTAMEKPVNGKWQYFAGFCPSIEPLFGAGHPEGDFIRHTLPAGDTFELAISNLGALRLEKAEEMRIMYFVGAGRQPVYSNVFIVRP